MHHNDNNYSNLNTLSTTPPTCNPLSLYLHTSSFRPAGSDFSTSPLSSAATSPTSSPPTSPFRRGLYRNVSGSPDNRDNRSQSPLRLPASLRRSSLVVLRGRPSAVDLALSEERSRCDEDSVERQGIDLMEPRPVDPVSIPMDLDANVFPTSNWNASRGSFQSMTQAQCTTQGQARNPQQPRIVMGGIFEVMEGSA